MSLQPPSLVTAFLISDPTAHTESGTTAPCFLSELTVLTPAAVIVLFAAKANRALPPKTAQKGEIAIVRDTTYATQLGALLDVWPLYHSPLLLVSALFSTGT